jgi:8-oxo-dGTP pyrophosphatase MutT (NUDIX family)
VNGVDAHLRRHLLPLPPGWEPTPLRRAAVLAPIVAGGGGDRLLLLVRRDDLREHAGQVAFPGGADDGDAGPVACALREAEEEVGLRAAGVTLLGSLPPRRSTSDFLVHCVVGRAADPGDGAIDPREVARLLRIPLRELVDRGRWYEQAPPPRADGRTFPASPHFDWGGDVVWGLTGRFVHELAGLLARMP